MDFNFMSVLSHAVHEDLWLATELIFEYLDEQAGPDMLNYNLIMQNVQGILDRNFGMNLCKFMEDESFTSNFSIKLDDDRLDPNQFFTKVDYYKYDHTSKRQGTDQIVQMFKDVIKSQKKGEEPIRVAYRYVDFMPLLF